MSTEKINPRFFLLLLLIVAAAAMRVPNAAQVTPWANFTPIGAMGLFGGAYFNSTWKKFAFPLLTLFLSDLMISQFVYGGKYGVMYGGWYWIYGIFAAIVLLGQLLLKKVTVKNIFFASIAAALLHWGLADFSVWAGGGTDLRTGLPLSRDWSGLAQCYLQGFPFMQNFLAGTLGYGALLFGSFECMKKAYPRLAY
ncbi:MAG: DUF6580 family putative transport protein [Bacteroidota bacterium]|nr:hypothetical protein [Ferruginibacter sp.]